MAVSLTRLSQVKRRRYFENTQARALTHTPRRSLTPSPGHQEEKALRPVQEGLQVSSALLSLSWRTALSPSVPVLSVTHPLLLAQAEDSGHERLARPHAEAVECFL